MDKQLIRTVLITMAIVFAYQYFFAQPQLEAERAARAKAEAQLRDSAPVVPSGPAAPLPPAGAGTDSRAAAPAETAPLAVPAATRTLATPEQTIAWDNRHGGVITGVRLHSFVDHTRTDSLQLVPAAAASSALRPAFGPVPVAVNAAPLPVAGETAIVAAIGGQPVAVTVELTAVQPYLYRVVYRLRNAGTVPVALNAVPFSSEAGGIRGSFSVSWGPALGDSLPTLHGPDALEIMYCKNNSIETIKPGSSGSWFSAGGAGEGETKEFSGGDLQWAALMDRYFIAALVPDSPAAGLKAYLHGNQLTWEMIFPELLFAPGEEKAVPAQLYIGPKEHARLAAMNVKLEETLNFGWFSWVGYILLGIMKWFYAVIPNFGLAIILLTLLVRICIYPLTYTSYQSMQRMQALQPKLQDIRAKYPNSPEKQQQEIMKMYQEEKVNPLGGCLPVLLQLPIFIALFQMLQYSIELRQAPFLWWITDLSQPDTVAFLPHWLPFFGGAALNILPFFMAATMFIQQKMSMTGLNPQQEKIMLFMPVMLLFMLYSFPSGLMLYWSLSNLVGVVQQKYLTRGKKPALPPRPAAGDAKKK